MAESHFLSALKQRRGECLGELAKIRSAISDLEESEGRLIAKLGHVDALLLDEAPELALDTIRPRKPREPHPRSGSDGRDPAEKRLSIAKATLRVLRTGGSPMTVNGIMKHLLHDYPDSTEKALKVSVRL